RIFPGEVFCCNCSCSRSALERDFHRVENGNQAAIISIVKNDHPLDCWQPKTDVVLCKVSVQFRGNVILHAAQVCSLDVKTAALCPYTKNSRWRNFPFALPAKNSLHRVDAFGQTQQFLYIAAIKQKG